MTAQNLLNSRQLKDLLGGITDMTLWRWSQRNDLDFPKPIMIAKRRYWNASDIDAFLERQRSAA